MFFPLTLFVLCGAAASAGEPGAADTSVGVVCHVKVLSDKVPDVSSLEAWQRSFIDAKMSDRDKGLAAWRSTVMFQHQDAPPLEYLHNEQVVQDPIKVFNVYGYSFCSVACCDIAALARAAGLKVRGWAINGHSVPEVYWQGAWHMLDASLINYFPKADGSIASVEDLLSAVKDWYDKHPEYKERPSRLEEFQRRAGWTGWRKGPDLLARCPFYGAGGYWPAGTHGWCNTMQEYDGTYGPKRKPFLYEYGYSQGYQVNVQLRPGERLTRNWHNEGLHVNMHDKGTPGCLNLKTGSGALAYTPKFGDLAPGRIGNGRLEYRVPVTDGRYRSAALLVDNLDEHALKTKDAARAGSLILRMPCPYVYLTGTLTFTAEVGAGGSVSVSYSDNHGLDWKEIARTRAAGENKVDLSPLVLRRYDYRLKFELRGAGAAITSLHIAHDIQHSQRPLPALGQGENTITFSAGAPEGTITIEGSANLASKDKQLVYRDFHPELAGFDNNLFVGPSGKGTITFPITTPGDMTRLRMGSHYRARDTRDGLDYQVSFDDGKSWQTMGRAEGPTAGHCKYLAFEAIPPHTRRALVRYAGTSRNATGLLNFRIDADYREPRGGFRPVKLTYSWEENGKIRTDVHIARQSRDTYRIGCASTPVMKSLVLELAD